MKNATIVAIAALLGLPSSRPRPDITLLLIEYRVLGQIGQVRVSTGFVHDPETQRSMLARISRRWTRLPWRTRNRRHHRDRRRKEEDRLSL